mgnify:CR=1 FL=1
MAERFGVVVAVGLTFFGLMLIAAQDVGIQIGGGSSPPDRLVLTSQNFGEVGGARTDIRTSNLGSFTIGEGRGNIRAYRDDKVDISNSLLSSNSIEFEYNATQPTQAAMSFEVLGKTGNGAVYVQVNGKKIFEEKLVTTATETINVSGDDLKPGMNSFKVGTTKGGLLSSTTYALEDFEATVNDRKFNDHVDSFQMYQYELEEYVGTNLSFNIPVDSSIITKPLQISVNDNNVFDSRSVRSDKSINIPRSDAELQPGYNTIKFETEADATYEIENAQVTVRYIGITESADREISFEINESNLDYVNRENTDESVMFDYQEVTGSNTLYLEIGEFNRTISPVNGPNTMELPEGILSETNTLQFESEGSFTLNNFRIISERSGDS